MSKNVPDPKKVAWLVGVVTERLVGGDIETCLNVHVAAGFGDVTVAIVGLLLVFWLARFLYQRKVFLRL